MEVFCVFLPLINSVIIFGSLRGKLFFPALSLAIRGNKKCGEWKGVIGRVCSVSNLWKSYFFHRGILFFQALSLALRGSKKCEWMGKFKEYARIVTELHCQWLLVGRVKAQRYSKCGSILVGYQCGSCTTCKSTNVCVGFGFVNCCGLMCPSSYPLPMYHTYLLSYVRLSKCFWLDSLWQVRDQAILLNLGSLRAIASADNVLIFDYKR